MEVPDLIDALEAEGHRFAAVAETTDFDVIVPTCPDWRLRELVQHLGGVHRWAATYVEAQRAEPLDVDLPELVGGWPPDGELVAWFRQGHAALVEALRAAPADLECFTFLEAPSPLAHWARRQAHETGVHRVDAESAASGVRPFPTPFTPAVGADGIDELVTAFITRPRVRLRADRARTLGIGLGDDPAAWTVHVGPESVETTRVAEGADATISGTASDVFLVLWNRLGTERIDLEGDAGVLELFRDRVRVRWR